MVRGKDCSSMQYSSLLGHTQELLGLVLKSAHPADSVIDTFFRSHRYLGAHDRRFIAETVYGTLRHLRNCQYRLERALAGVAVEPSEADRHLLLIVSFLAITHHQQEHLPAQLGSLLRNAQAKENAAKLFSTLAEPIAVREDSRGRQWGIEYSYPDWMVDVFRKEYGPQEAEQILRAMNEPAPLTLRVNTLKGTVAHCKAELEQEGIDAVRTNLSPMGLRLAKRMNVFSSAAFKQGMFEMQDEGSQLLPLLIDPKPTAKVLDVCAGAGGKTLAFAALMKNRGEIYATDVNNHRLEELRKRAKRSGAQNIRVRHIQNVDELAMEFEAFFDIVFVDAPCSGLGTLRRNPGMKWMVTEQSVREISEKQRAILRASAALVKPDGMLIYATCTLLSEENESTIEDFLSAHPEFILTEPALGGLPSEIRSENFIKLKPHMYGTDGFFCAFLKRDAPR